MKVCYTTYTVPTSRSRFTFVICIIPPGTECKVPVGILEVRLEMIPDLGPNNNVTESVVKQQVCTVTTELSTENGEQIGRLDV